MHKGVSSHGILHQTLRNSVGIDRKHRPNTTCLRTRLKVDLDGKGSKQVSIIGLNEKRALTLVVSVSNSGVFLPLQSIYAGKKAKVMPSKFADKYQESQDAGFCWEFANSGTYWSTLETIVGVRVADPVAIQTRSSG